MVYRLGPVTSVQTFMERIWGSTPDSFNNKRLFRGQADEWDLLPKLFRAKDISRANCQQYEDRLMEEFRERCFYLLPSAPALEINVLSVAQHYGLPTRLLDWTSNPLMALYFSVEKCDAQRPTVWMYDGRFQQTPDIADFSSTNADDFIRIVLPTRHSHRIAAQAGWHTVHPISLHWPEGGTAPVPMNHLKAHNGVLTVISIDPGMITAIRQELRDMGIGAATVYGDLSSVCREIEDDLEIPQSMRRDPALPQEAVQVHVLALLLANGLRRRPGQQYYWMGELDAFGSSVGGKAIVDTESWRAACELARRYNVDFRPDQ